MCLSSCLYIKMCSRQIVDPLQKNSLRSLLPPTHTMANLIPFQLSLTHPRTHCVSFTAQESSHVVSMVESFILSMATELPTPHPPAQDSAYMCPKHYLTQRLDWLVTQMDDPLPSHESVAPYLLSEESESQGNTTYTMPNLNVTFLHHSPWCYHKNKYHIMHLSSFHMNQLLTPTRAGAINSPKLMSMSMLWVCSGSPQSMGPWNILGSQLRGWGACIQCMDGALYVGFAVGRVRRGRICIVVLYYSCT
ncbi:hypothetical protein EDC04DRAFT_2783714 [Pisolithus marmoratus]|nr:hypothetical protein EDC04DRAFT_2783714 [Pisolithus marmoratus]